MKKALIILVVCLVCLFAGLILGYGAGKDNGKETTVTAEVIVERLQEQGFLVTQTAVFAEHVEIKEGTGNGFKDFFLGQTIDAYASLSVDMGVDLSTLESNDVIVEEDQVQIRLPRVETRAPVLLGSIDVHNKQGIIKKLLDNDDGYNSAIKLLKEQASARANEENVQQQAFTQAQEQLVRFLGLLQAPQEIVFIDD